MWGSKQFCGHPAGTSTGLSASPGNFCSIVRLNPVRHPVTLEGGPVMSKVFMIIVVAVAMFGVAAVAMARHHHNTHTYADLQRQ
jgi:hypothetical protein